nr:unnamed protein product [Digitaria exilis]
MQVQLYTEQYVPRGPSERGGGLTRQPLGAARALDLSGIVVAALPHQRCHGLCHPHAPDRFLGRENPSRHEVYAYDTERNSADTGFPELLLNIAMHEETVTGVCRHRVAGSDPPPVAPCVSNEPAW